MLLYNPLAAGHSTASADPRSAAAENVQNKNTAPVSVIQTDSDSALEPKTREISDDDTLGRDGSDGEACTDPVRCLLV